MSPLATLYSSIVLFFPFWIQIWEKEPISSQHLNTQGHYEVQSDVLAKIQQDMPFFDADLRTQILRELSGYPIPAHQKLMLQFLHDEKVPEVQSTNLQLLQKTDLATIPPTAIAPLLNSENVDVVENSIRLYGQLPDADLSNLILSLLRCTHSAETAKSGLESLLS